MLCYKGYVRDMAVKYGTEVVYEGLPLYKSRVLQKSIGGVKTGSVACHTRNGFSTPYKVITY